MSDSEEIPDKVRRLHHQHDTPVLRSNERRTQLVVLISLITMIIELFFGWWTHSMALTADGWHMASHVGALGLSLLGYWFARKHAASSHYSFGTGKVFSLSGFASGVALGIAGILVAQESVYHLLHPEEINFSMAMLVAVIGLVVNLISAWLLSGDESASHGHDHGHSHGHGHDHNLRAAWLHVLADALTSLLAIVALGLGKWLDWVFLDPLIGVVGGLIIIRWALSLCTETSQVLLDRVPSTEEVRAVQDRLLRNKELWVSDLHIWDLGLSRKSAVVSVVAHNPQPPDFYKAQIREVGHFQHITVEVHSLLDEDFGGCNHSAAVQGFHGHHHHDHGHEHHHEEGEQENGRGDV